MPISSGPLRPSDSDRMICSAALEESFPRSLPSGTILKRFQSHYLLTSYSPILKLDSHNPVSCLVRGSSPASWLTTFNKTMGSEVSPSKQKEYSTVTSEFPSCDCDFGEIIPSFSASSSSKQLGDTHYLDPPFSLIVSGGAGVQAAGSGSKDTERKQTCPPDL